MAAPLKSPRVTCPFKYVSQRKPSPWAAGYHPGIDYQASVGTSVYAPADAKIIYAGESGWGGAYGDQVIGESEGTDGNTYRWICAHNSSLKVKTGQRVKLGDLIAKSGETGNTFGPHVHFEVRKSPFKYADHVNPKVIVGVKDSVKPTTVVHDTLAEYGPSEFGTGRSGPQIVLLRKRLAAHGAISDKWGVGDKDNVARFQRAQGWTGTGADGLPGKKTLRRLDADPKEPKPDPEPVKPEPGKPPAPAKPDNSDAFTIKVLEVNMAYYNAAKGEKRAIGKIPIFAKRFIDSEADVLLLVECGSGMLTKLDNALSGHYKRAPGGAAGREIYVKTTHKIRHSGLGQIDTEYQGDDKPWAWAQVDIKGVKFGFVAFHLEHETTDAAERVRLKQIVEVIQKADKKFGKLGVATIHRVYAGDGNSYGHTQNEAGKHDYVSAVRVAKKKVNAEYKTHNNWREPIKGGHFDFTLVRKSPNVVVKKWLQKLNKGLSDHHITITTIRYKK